MLNRIPKGFSSHDSIEKEIKGIEKILKEQTGKLEYSQHDLKKFIEDKSTIDLKYVLPSSPPLNLDFLTTKLDSIYYLLKSDTIKIIDTVFQSQRQLLTHSDSAFIGQKVAFAVTNARGSGKIKKNDLLDIYRVYVVDNNGNYIPKNDRISGEEVAFEFPVEGFEITSNIPGAFQSIIETECQSDTVNLNFKQKTINYSISTDVKVSKQYDVNFKVRFSDEVFQDLMAEIEMRILKNNEDIIYRDTVYIPKGTTLYSKNVPYEINGRKPYCFSVKATSFRPVETIPGIIFEQYEH